MNSKAILLVGVLLLLGVEGRPQHSVPSKQTQPQQAVTEQQPSKPTTSEPHQPSTVEPQSTTTPVVSQPQAPHHPSLPVVPVIPAGEPVGNGKFAVVVTGRTTTWNMAAQACQTIPVPAGATGVSLFTANTPSDSSWLAGRMNSPFGSSEYWVGLKSGPAFGTVSWVDGTPFTYSHTEILSGHDDPTKVFGMATSDGIGIEYEFLTPTDDADGYICQYRIPPAPAPAQG